jgi:hypothetical protein
MVDREKLIELLKNSPYLYVLGRLSHYEEAADHLIANGVTIQKWIPVTERLPDADTRVLVYLRDGYGGNAMIDTDRLHNGRWVRWSKFITHWMPLPEPPKEVE